MFIIVKFVFVIFLFFFVLLWLDIVFYFFFLYDYVWYDIVKFVFNFFVNGFEVSVVCEMFGDEFCFDIVRKGCLVFKGNWGDSGEWIVGSGKLVDEIVKVLWNIFKYWVVSCCDDNCGKILMICSF